jgi:hypothetical protein
MLMSQKLKYFLLALIFILASLPLFRFELFQMHDFTHGARIAEMTRALQDGHFPVRWSENFGFGYGMPLYQFYAPLPFYVGALIYWLSGNLILAVKLLFILSNGLTLVGAYLLGRELFKNERSGILSAAILTLAPYRALNLYIRGALSEAWGIMVVPWILWSIVKVLQKKKYSQIWLIISLTVLFLSHNLSVVIFAPLIIMISLVLLWQKFYQNQPEFLIAALWSLIWPSVTAFGLSAFYLIPSFFEKDLTQLEELILGGYFQYSLHFVYLRQFLNSKWGFGGSQWGADDPISFFLGWGQWLVILISLIYLVIISLKKKRQKEFKIQDWILPGTVFFFFGFYILLTTHKTEFIWDSVSILEFIQFPWRFLAGAIMAISLLSGWLAQQIENIFTKQLWRNMIFGLLLLASLVNFIYFRPESYLEDSSNLYYADASKIRAEMSYILPDYLPQKISLETLPVDKLILNQEELEENSYSIVVNRTHEKLIETDFHKTQQLELGIAAYPYWMISFNLDQPFIPKVKQGHLVVDVPKGKQRVAVKLYPTKLRLVSDLISLAALISLILILFINYQESSYTQSCHS